MAIEVSKTIMGSQQVCHKFETYQKEITDRLTPFTLLPSTKTAGLLLLYL